MLLALRSLIDFKIDALEKKEGKTTVKGKKVKID